MKKFFKRILVAITVIIMAVSVMPMTQADAAVKLSATKKVVYVGESFTLKVSGSSKTVKWSSSKKSVASVTQKGKVTAKKAGKATITAKVSGKSLKCAVTVNEKFSSSAALKNISVDLKDTGKGVVAILKNDNGTVVSIDATMVYFKNGKMIGTTESSNYAFESGSTCALCFGAPYDSNYDNVDYDDYKISMKITNGSDSLVLGSKKIKVDSNFGADNVVANVSNNSGKQLGSIAIAIVYYNSYGDAIGCDYTYADCNTDGSEDYISFSFPYDSNYDTIYPSDYEIYVNFAYSYDWEL